MSDQDVREWLAGPVAELVRQVKSEETMSSKTLILVACRAEIYTLRASDLAVTEAQVYGSTRYCAIGAGRHWAYGSLRTSAALGCATLEVASRLALEAAAEHSPMVGGPPFDFLETSS